MVIWIPLINTGNTSIMALILITPPYKNSIGLTPEWGNPMEPC